MKISCIPIVIDGPNFINRILDMGIDTDLISKQLTLGGLREFVNIMLKEKGLSAQCETVEFVCSKKLFGSGSKKFSQSERDSMLQRLMAETGVYIEEVNLPGSTEKGVDNMVSVKIETFSEKFKSIVLVSEDRDFVPVIRKMREKGKQIILVSLKEQFPFELVNEAYLTIDIKDDYQYLFNYSYPYFFLEENFTLEHFRQLIANADDRKNNQIRVDRNGRVYISHKYVGGDNLLGVKFRFETFAAYNEYVGPKAASNKEFVGREFEEIQLAWELDVTGYIDYPVTLAAKTWIKPEE